MTAANGPSPDAESVWAWLSGRMISPPRCSPLELILREILRSTASPVAQRRFHCEGGRVALAESIYLALVHHGFLLTEIAEGEALQFLCYETELRSFLNVTG